MSEKKLNPIEKAHKNPKSRVAAIAAKCYDCSGGFEDDPGTKGSVVSLVRSCPISRCPLYTLRGWK